MISLLRWLFLLLFVEKRSRKKAEAVMLDRRSGAAGAAVSREQLIQQALEMRQKKEHLWEDLSEEERAELLEQLGDGMEAQIEQIKGASG